MVSVSDQEVFSWFRQLPSYRRLEILCQLLNLCVPFELRFLESYLTKLASREFCLHLDLEKKANKVDEVSKYCVGLGPLDAVCRSRLIITMALIKSDNTAVASVLFPALQKGLPNDKSSLALLEPKCLEELVLLYTMCALHPAFSFHQHTVLENLKSGLEKLTQPTPKPTNAPPAVAQSIQNIQCPPGVQQVYTYPLISSAIPPPFQWFPPPNLQLPAVPPGFPPSSGIPSLNANSLHPVKKLSQVVMTPSAGNCQKVTLCGTFVDGRTVQVIKDYAEIAELRNKLTGQLPSSSCTNLPSLSTMYNNNTEVVHKEIRELFNEICANFADLDLVCNFFEQSSPASVSGVSPMAPVNVMTPTVGPPLVAQPHRFSAPPPPYSCTDASLMNHQQSLQEVLRGAQLIKYAKKFNDVNSINDFCSLSQESLKSRGLSTAAIQKIQRVQSAANGQVAMVVPNGQSVTVPPSVCTTAPATNGSSEEDSTPPSSSPSPPAAHNQFTAPPPQYFGFMVPTVPVGSGYVPTTYTGYPFQTFIPAASPQHNGYIQPGVLTNGHQTIMHPMMAPPPVPLAGASTNLAAAVTPTQTSTNPVTPSGSSQSHLSGGAGGGVSHSINHHVSHQPPSSQTNSHPHNHLGNTGQNTGGSSSGGNGSHNSTSSSSSSSTNHHHGMAHSPLSSNKDCAANGQLSSCNSSNQLTNASSSTSHSKYFQPACSPGVGVVVANVANPASPVVGSVSGSVAGSGPSSLNMITSPNTQSTQTSLPSVVSLSLSSLSHHASMSPQQPGDTASSAPSLALPVPIAVAVPCIGSPHVSQTNASHM